MSTKTTYEQALELESLGFYADAAILFDECLRDSAVPRGDVLFHYGWCMEQHEGADSTVALALYERALEDTLHTGGRTHAAFRAGWILLHQKRHAEASEMFKRALDEGGGSSSHQEIKHNAMYWLAVSLEAENRFLEAITWYRKVSTLSRMLDPEARLRQMYCLVSIGDFETALALSRTFEQACPEGFSEIRYRDLSTVAAKEGTVLESCLHQGTVSMN